MWLVAALITGLPLAAEDEDRGAKKRGLGFFLIYYLAVSAHALS